MITPDYRRRDYLLPKGCKDLADAIDAKGEIFVSEQTPVGLLAVLLGQKSSRVITDLKQLGIFATAEQGLDSRTMRIIARRYGYAAKVIDFVKMPKARYLAKTGA
jgi:hypothetical protein